MSLAAWAALATAFVVLGGIAWFALCSSPYRKKRISLPPTELGGITVVPRAVERVAWRVGMAIPGVSRLKTRVEKAPGGIRIRVRLWISEERDLARVLGQVRENLELAVGRLVGIPVIGVNVVVQGLEGRALAGRG